MEETESTEVKYKNQAMVIAEPVLNVRGSLNWMTKLSWKAMGCYRRVFFMTCIIFAEVFCGIAGRSRRKASQLVPCCQAAKMRMTG